MYNCSTWYLIYPSLFSNPLDPLFYRSSYYTARLHEVSPSSRRRFYSIQSTWWRKWFYLLHPTLLINMGLPYLLVLMHIWHWTVHLSIPVTQHGLLVLHLLEGSILTPKLLMQAPRHRFRGYLPVAKIAGIWRRIQRTNSIWNTLCHYSLPFQRILPRLLANFSCKGSCHW